MFFYFKQPSLNIKKKIEFLHHLINGERLFSVVVGVVSFSFDKPLDFHDTIFQHHLVFLKYNRAVEVLNKVVIHHF